MPAATVDATFTVIVCGVEGVRVNVVPGLSVAPVGNPETVTPTELLKPLSGAMLTTNVVDVPEFRERV